MQQTKINILSTKALDDDLSREANANGVLLDVLPFIRIEFISSTEVQRKIQQVLAITTTIVFTSTHAVEAVESQFKDQKFTSNVFCIGHATKQSVEKYFGENSIAGVADNAEELASTIVSANVRKVVFFCGDQRRDELPNLLKKNGIGVNEIAVYKTTLTPGKIEKKYDGILFFSPSAVVSFFQNNKLGDQTVLFAIGNTTADEIKKFSKNKIVISDAPEAKILLRKATEFFQANPIHH